MKVKVIDNDEQYRRYLEEVERLLLLMPAKSSEEDEKLKLLTILIQEYEAKQFPQAFIDPIDAIKFRMKEKNLKQKDLTPYFGTKSRVSEVLSRKRPLTVQMIRALSIGLGISAETLIGSSKDNQFSPNQSSINWSKFPIKEMIKRGWINSKVNEKRNELEDKVKNFIEALGKESHCAAFKRTIKGDAYSPATTYSLFAWISRVVQKARTKNISVKFDENVFSSEFLKELAQLSWSEYGPKLAIEYLEKNGIKVVIVPALKGTLVDGAALKDKDGQPIIGLTLRHDRLDNFWFTLLHEVVHIWKHVDTNETFIDDLSHQSEDKIEAEANRIARDTFIPRTIWKRSNAYLNPSKSSIDQLSRELRIHPAIIAGRIRKEKSDYTKFNDLIGLNEVRKFFPEFTEEV